MRDTKRILVVAHNFGSPSMGGIRLRRIVRSLAQRGYEVTVLAYPHKDCTGSEPEIRVVNVRSLSLKNVSDKLRSITTFLRRRQRSRTGAPSAHAGKPTSLNIALTTWINRWLMVPDKEAPWIRAACREALSLHRQDPFDLVFASLHPKSNALAAARFAARSGCPLAVEYRDLWTGSMYANLAQPTRFHVWLHRRMERRVLARAQLVSSVCKGIDDYLAAQYPTETAGNRALNYNFFDPEEYPPDASGERRPFTIAYAGALYMNRRPDVFFEGFSRFVRTNRLAPSEIRFRWMGQIAGVAQLDETDVALLIQAVEDRIHIPGKLFEALGARTPVLALANVDEVHDIMERCNAGYCGPHTPEFVANSLQQFRLAHLSGAPWPFNEQEVARHSAQAAIARLVKCFHELLAANAGIVLKPERK